MPDFRAFFHQKIWFCLFISGVYINSLIINKLFYIIEYQAVAYNYLEIKEKKIYL